MPSHQDRVRRNYGHTVAMFKGKPAEELTHSQLLHAYKKVCEAAEQEREWNRQSIVMDRMFEDALKAISMR